MFFFLPSLDRKQ